MAKDETEIQMVQRHIREGEAHVRRQREIITEIQEQGMPTDMALTAVALLEQFQDALNLHKAHLVRLKAR